jgi:chondroitin AC lyase
LRVRGKSKFAGGVSDGTIGLAAMDLQREGLSARKTWIYFDDCYVCLGAGISCGSDNPVTTSINQCLLSGKVSEGESWVHHGNVGYVVGDRKRVRMTAGPQEGRWSEIGTGSQKLERKDVFNLWIDHGTRPRDETYQYIVLPGASADQAARAAANPAVEVITNSEQQQAVFHRGLNALAVAFWKAGKISGGGHTIEVNQPCLVLVRNDGAAAKLAVADPTQEVSAVIVTLDGTATEIKLPQGDHAGASAAVVKK